MEHIEKSERVIDPLGAATDCPFGHLLAIWKKFRDELRTNYGLSARWSRELHGQMSTLVVLQYETT